MIHPPAPVQKAMIAKNDRQPVGLYSLDEGGQAKAVKEEGDRAHGRVEHEQPQHHAGGAGKRAGDVIDEAGGGRQVARADRVDDDGEQHHQHDEAGEPDEKEEADVLDRGQEAVVLEHLDEVGEADEGAALGESEIDGVGRRQQAEDDEKESIGEDEQASLPTWARCTLRLASVNRGPARTGQGRWQSSSLRRYVREAAQVIRRCSLRPGLRSSSPAPRFRTGPPWSCLRQGRG